MNKTTRLIAIGVVGLAVIFAIGKIGFGLFAVGANASAKMSDAAAEALMKSNGAAMGTLAKMAKGELAFDATAAAAAKQTLLTNTVAIPDAFKLPFDEADAKALPAIWEKREDFIAKSTALGDAVSALDVTSAQSLGAGLAGVGTACGSCHDAYRGKS